VSRDGPNVQSVRPKSYGLARRHLWCDGVNVDLIGATVEDAMGIRSTLQQAQLS
jgi:hypothetical protein